MRISTFWRNNSSPTSLNPHWTNRRRSREAGPWRTWKKISRSSSRGPNRARKKGTGCREFGKFYSMISNNVHAPSLSLEHASQPITRPTWSKIQSTIYSLSSPKSSIISSSSSSTYSFSSLPSPSWSRSFGLACLLLLSAPLLWSSLSPWWNKPMTIIVSI